MLINSTNLEAANRAIQTELNSINERIPQGVHQLFTSVESKKGTSVDHLVVMLHNAFQEWIGPRSEGGARAYRGNYPIRRWERTIRLPVAEINGDVTGVLAAAVASLQAREGWYMEEIVIAELVLVAILLLYIVADVYLGENARRVRKVGGKASADVEHRGAGCSRGGCEAHGSGRFQQ